MKLVIFGDRNFTDYKTLKLIIESCESFKKGFITQVISGKARGADTLGERWAREHNIPVLSYPAEWDKYGKGAGPIRNRQMAEVADIGIGFLAPTSKGTKDMIKTCRKFKVPILIYHIDSKQIEIFKTKD
jgi:hypothetical protein